MLVMTNEQELWGVALWVEKHHGPNGQAFIAAQLERLAGDPQGLAMWRRVAARLDEMQTQNQEPC